MIPQCIAEGAVLPRHLNALRIVAAGLNRATPDTARDPAAIAYTAVLTLRTFAAAGPELVVVSGTFAGQPYTWLAWVGEGVILDPCPPGCASGPLLVTTIVPESPWGRLYADAVRRPAPPAPTPAGTPA